MSMEKILVVDDEPQMRRVMRTTLTAQGYEAVDARSGEEALLKLEAERFDFILLDLNLP
jgi:two-component system KDP operon response regulator KdpE